MDRAIAAHQRLVSQVYAPMQDHLRELQQEAERLKQNAKAEEERGLSSGFIGYGDKARELDKLALEKDIEAKKFQKTLEELTPKFQYDFTGLTPTDILNQDRKARNAAPEEFRKNSPELERGAYIDEDAELSLLAPYLKVVNNREEAALLSLIMALGVDGIAIILGTAIVTKLIPPEERRSPVATVGHWIANLIREIKDTFAQVNHARKGSSQAQDNDFIEYVILNLKGKGSDFLNDFYYAISDTEPHIINSSKLIGKSGADENMPNLIRALVDKLRQPNRGWVERNEENTEWVVKPEHYHQLVNWLQEEIKRQKKLEAEAKKKVGNGFGFSHLEETEVEFKMPLNPNSLNPNSRN
ncbi:MAG: hypothetical protein F6K17_13515 [Okeania sp. SIO3C4]|nr:hypothetical protein [Okeania sp. SIO3C4]